MDNSLIPIIKELERIYIAINNHFSFHYPHPIIVIQTKGSKKNTLGWFSAERWQHNKKEISEITICAEELKKDPIETLIHEMSHYANHCEKVEDCNSQQYHNKYFKCKAENYGLNVEKDGRHGWSITSVSEKLQIILNDLKINKEVFKLYRKPHFSSTAPTKMKKYRCGCTTVRCATELQATCNACHKDFELCS